MRILLMLLLAAAAYADVVDRIAVVVSRHVITEAQIDEEIRVTAFLNDEPVKRDLATRRAAADRLIEQQLVRREMGLSQYPLPSQADVDKLFQQTEEEAGGPAGLAKKLASYGLTEAVLKEHLSFQLMTLKFIEFRFRPDVEISDQDIRDYYNRELEKWRQTHTGQPPSLEESKADIIKALSTERVDYALSSWIEETRKELPILYLDKELE